MKNFFLNYEFFKLQIEEEHRRNVTYKNFTLKQLEEKIPVNEI